MNIVLFKFYFTNIINTYIKLCFNSLLAYQLIRSAKKSKTSELPNRHSITVEGNEIELPKITHHAMITRLDELESTPKLDFCTHSVVKSEYKHHEHIKSGLQDNSILVKSSYKFISIAKKSGISSTTHLLGFILNPLFPLMSCFHPVLVYCLCAFYYQIHFGCG